MYFVLHHSEIAHSSEHESGACDAIARLVDRGAKVDDIELIKGTQLTIVVRTKETTVVVM